MIRALRILATLSMVFGCVIGVPFVVLGAMLHAKADKRQRALPRPVRCTE